MKSKSFPAYLAAIALAVCIVFAAPLSAMAQTVIAPAGATEAIPQPNGSTVFLYPLINGLEPYIVIFLGGLITVIGGFATAFLKQHFNIVLSAAQQDKLISMAKTEAGIWVAKADGAAMNASIDIGSPGIAAAGNRIIVAVPDIARDLGVSPTSVQQMIVGEIGKLQAAAPTVVPAAK
jgi:hypothetical protein